MEPWRAHDAAGEEDDPGHDADSWGTYVTDATAELRLEPEPSAAHTARRFVADVVAQADRDELAGDLQLVATELVTNAVLHGEPPVAVRVDVTADRVRIEVADGSRARPVRGLARADAMTGRGLALVAAVSDRWGSDLRSSGKVVWAEFGADTDVAGHAEAAVDDVEALLAAWDDAQLEPLHRVHLGDVPTDLLLSAKAHVDNLLREFTLTRWGVAPGADAAGPLGALLTSVSRRFTEARESIKRQAIASAHAGAERTTLVLELPLHAADAGEEYLTALDTLDSYARAARLLTLETPPQHRVFRRWYVEEIVAQLRARATGAAAPPPTTFESRLLAEVGALSAANRTTESAARLQVVTAALARARTPEEVAAVVVSEGVAVLGASGGSLLVPDGNHLRVPGAVGYPEELLRRLVAETLDEQLPAIAALRTGAPVWVESPQERDERFPDLAVLEPNTRSLCAIPLTLAGTVLGVLRFSFDDTRLFDQDARRFATALAAQTAQALERANLFLAERAAKERWAFLSDASEALSASLEPEATMRRLTSLLVPRLADWAVIHLCAAEGGVPVAVAVAHRDPAVEDRLATAVFGRPLDVDAPGGVGEVIRTRKSVRYTEVPGHVRERAASYAPDAESAAAVEPETGLSAPMVHRGEVVGAITLARLAGGTPYTDADLDLVEDLAARAAVAVANARQYHRERDAALTLQRSLLPRTLPLLRGMTLAWRYLPGASGSAVGGDWYDVIPIDDDAVGLVIGDVMGRGVQAAAVMGQLRASARAYATTDLPVAEVLHRLDDAVAGLEQSQITTMLYGVLRLSSGELTMASAGHLPPLVVTPEGVPTYPDIAPGPPLGVGMPEYVEGRVLLTTGSTLLLYTDGLVEDHTRGVDEGMEQLRSAAEGVTDPDELCERALSALSPGESSDDIALLAVRIDGGVDR